MGKVVSWGLRLVAAALLLLGQGLAHQPGEALAQETLKQLTDTTDGYYYTYPSVSADGTRIAFRSEGLQEIYVINSDGTGFRRLVGGGLTAQSRPSISADGQWVAFVAQDPQAPGGGWYMGDIYVMRTDGTRLRQLTPSLDSEDPDENFRLSGGRASPVISGDGSLVVFSSNADFTRQNADRSGELFVVRSDGTGLRQITNTTNVSAPNIGEIQVTQSAFSPAVDHGGSRVAFWLSDDQLKRVEGGGEWVSRDQSLYVVNSDGSGLSKLSQVMRDDLAPGGDFLGERPSISGDGSRVAFPAYINVNGGNPDGNLELFTIKTDGTGLLQLTSISVGRSAFPSLNFNGSRIAFTQQNPTTFAGQWYEVYAINADGSGLTQLTSTGGNPIERRSGYEGVAFSADGSHVAFSSSGDLVGKNADGNYEIYLRRLSYLLPVQGIRNEKLAADLANNRHSLVSRRDLVVRAFFDTGSGGPSAQARGRLVVDGGTPGETTFQVDGYTARPLGYFDDKPDARVRLEDSLNFFITGKTADDLLTPGVHTFKVRVEPEAAGAFTPWEETFQANLRQADTMDIFVIPVRVKNAAGVFVDPDANVLGDAVDFLRATYPVDEDLDKVRAVDLVAVERDAALLTPDLRFELLQDVQDRLSKQLLLGQIPNPARRNFAAGVAPYNVDGQNPLGKTASGGERVGYTNPHIPDVVVSLDRSPFAANPPVIGSTIAHEIGHILGLGDEYIGGRVSPNNPPPPTDAGGNVDGNYGNVNGNYVLEIARGLDNANRVAVFNRPAAEFLGYMGGGHDLNSWARGIDYSFTYSQVTTDTVGGSWVAAAPSTRFINVSGVISLTGGIQLRPFVVATSPYTFTRPSGTQYAFQFRGGSGAVLDTVGFDVDFTEEVRGAGYFPLDKAPFSFTVPLPEGVASMVALTGTTPMITYTVSAQPPAVTVLAPNGGETLRERSQVRWQASDPDGDTLTYTVIYSPNGTDRYVVASHVATTTLDLDFSRVPRGDRAYVIVRASDGFNAAEDASDAPFTAGPRAVFLPFVAKTVAGW